MGIVIELPEAGIRSWQVFADGVRAIGQWPPAALEHALQEMRPLFLEAWNSSNLTAVGRDTDDGAKQVSLNISNIVLPLLFEIVRCKVELYELTGQGAL